MRRSLFGACAVAMLSVLAHAQATFVVGPPGSAPFQQVDDALQVAQPGDRIEMLPGTYPPFSADKAVTITGVPGSVFVQPPGGASIVARLTPAQGTLHVYGVEFVQSGPLWFNPSNVGVEITGRVTLDRCRIDLNGYLVDVDGADLHMQSSEVSVRGLASLTGFPALRADHATLTAVDCTFESRPTFLPGQLGTLTLTDSLLLASHSTIRGMNQLAVTSPAIVLDAQSTVLLSDSILEAESCPVRPASGSTALGTVLAARTQELVNATTTCTTPLVQTDLLGVTRTDELALGASFGMTLTGTPNTTLFVLAAPELATIEVPHLLAQPSWLDFGSYYLAATTSTDANGQAHYGFVVPNVQVLQGTTLWLEAIGYGPLPLLVSPPVGGVVTN